MNFEWSFSLRTTLPRSRIVSLLFVLKFHLYDSDTPSKFPSGVPSTAPSAYPSDTPSRLPSTIPTGTPTQYPTVSSAPSFAVFFLNNEGGSVTGECRVTPDGQCIISDGPIPPTYPTNYECSWFTTGAITLYAREFDFGTGDRFRIGPIGKPPGVSYFFNDTSFEGMTIFPGTRLSLLVNQDADVGLGFTICSSP